MRAPDIFASQRMAQFDAMPPDMRALANEYGINVVMHYLGESDLAAACRRHRERKQAQNLSERLT